MTTHNTLDLFADSFVQETTRLSSGVFVVRYVTQDTNFESGRGQKFLIREGDRIAIYPPALHKDPEIFEDPLVSVQVTVVLSCMKKYWFNDFVSAYKSVYASL